MKKFLGSNETRYRLGRTILQGVIGVLIANMDLLVSAWNFTPEVKAFIVALVMAVLSPIMSELGASVNTDYMAQQNTFNAEDILDMMGYEYEDQNYTAEE